MPQRMGLDTTPTTHHPKMAPDTKGSDIQHKGTHHNNTKNSDIHQKALSKTTFSIKALSMSILNSDYRL
jgi:hypothetical protein